MSSLLMFLCVSFIIWGKAAAMKIMKKKIEKDNSYGSQSLKSMLKPISPPNASIWLYVFFIWRLWFMVSLHVHW